MGGTKEEVEAGIAKGRFIKASSIRASRVYCLECHKTFKMKLPEEGKQRNSKS